MVLNSFIDVQQYLTKILTTNNQMGDTQSAPHGAFFNNLTYQQFVTGNVPNITDPNSGGPMPILVKGNAAQSNIILALQGAPNTPFDPNSGAFGQMPADGPPFFTAAQIQPLADWINAGCPQ